MKIAEQTFSWMGRFKAVLKCIARDRQLFCVFRLIKSSILILSIFLQFINCFLKIFLNWKEQFSRAPYFLLCSHVYTKWLIICSQRDIPVSVPVQPGKGTFHINLWLSIERMPFLSGNPKSGSRGGNSGWCTVKLSFLRSSQFLQLELNHSDRKQTKSLSLSNVYWHADMALFYRYFLSLILEITASKLFLQFCFWMLSVFSFKALILVALVTEKLKFRFCSHPDLIGSISNGLIYERTSSIPNV